MLKRLILVAALCVAAAPSFAVGQVTYAGNAQPAAQAAPVGSDRLIETGSYTNRAGIEVHRPAHTVSGQVPAGASAQCRDGSFSFSQSRRGTCSHHGGVRRWL